MRRNPPRRQRRSHQEGRRTTGGAEHHESRRKGVFQRENTVDWVKWCWQVKSDKDRELLVIGFSKIKIISVFEKKSFTC